MKRSAFFNFFLLISLLCIGAYIVWRYYPSLIYNQPILNNKNYPLELDSIQTIRKKLRKQNAGTTILEKKFIQLITQRIFPYWYGTRWNFHGTTETPSEGSIACGYFVTTTLRDMGVPINRVKMAQCASEQMIRSLTSKKNIHHLSHRGIREFERDLKKYGNGLYIIGLDKHTGFIFLSDKGNYFIHSSGMFPFQVIKEKLSESSILARSSYRVVGKISSDEQFLRKWVENKN